MGKRKKNLNPADAFRKKQRKKALKRNKEKRLAQRDLRLKIMTPEQIMNEIRKIERMEKEGEGMSKDHARVRKMKLREAHTKAIQRQKELEKKMQAKKEMEPVVIKGLSRIFRDIPKAPKPPATDEPAEQSYGLPPGMEPASAERPPDPSVREDGKAIESSKETETDAEEKKQGGDRKLETEVDTKVEGEEAPPPPPPLPANGEGEEGTVGEGQDKENMGIPQTITKIEAAPESDNLLDAPPGIKNKGPPRILRPHPAVFVQMMPRPQINPAFPKMMGRGAPLLPPPVPGHGMPPFGMPPHHMGMPPHPYMGRGGPGAPPRGPPMPQGGQQAPWGQPNPHHRMPPPRRGGGGPGGRRGPMGMAKDPFDILPPQSSAPPMGGPGQAADISAPPRESAGGAKLVDSSLVPTNLMVRKRTKQKLTVAQARALRAKKKRDAEEAAKPKAPAQAGAGQKTAVASYDSFMSEIESLGAL